MTSDTLAFVDALLSVATLGFLVAGYRAIRARQIERHRNRMLGAFACSTLFLSIFIFRFVTFGFHPYAGHGVWRVIYYSVLMTHEPIAVVSVPMALVTLGLGLARAKAHKELARPTAVIWAISAVTGILFFVIAYAT